MYKEFYLMKKEPFDSHPSPDLFYKSGAHQNGWNYLIHGIRKDEPILLVAGDYGAGKTLLYLKLIRQLKKSRHYLHVSVPTPTYNFVMVLEKIIETLIGLKPDSVDTPDELKLQQAIYEYFETQMEGKKPVIYVVIDDAQEFSYTFINKLRLFASYNYDGNFPIRIILFAHKSFLKMLGYKKLIAFGQRIKRIYQLDPLGFDETREYIYYRLIHSGATGTPVFDDDAIKLIQETSHGNPRLINNVCDNCLLVSCNERSNLIDRHLVHRALKGGNLMGIAEHPGESGFQAPAMRQGALPNGQPMGEPAQQPMQFPNVEDSPAAAFPMPEPSAPPAAPGTQPPLVYPQPEPHPMPGYQQPEPPAS
ncbi:MAG: AAA family ATPase, partial [Desulfobacterales bacterium]|nr:AAA family ATPase [Desulfobacterales bacterium]